MEEQDLGQMVRNHRRAAGLTRAQLASFSGVGTTTIYELESGKYTISLHRWLRLLEVLNLKVSYQSPLASRA